MIYKNSGTSYFSDDEHEICKLHPYENNRILEGEDIDNNILTSDVTLDAYTHLRFLIIKTLIIQNSSEDNISWSTSDVFINSNESKETL